MIDADLQHKGYGRLATLEALNDIKKAKKYDIVHLDYVPSITIARDLFVSIGFRESGEMDDDEVIMEYPLTDGIRLIDWMIRSQQHLSLIAIL